MSVTLPTFGYVSLTEAVNKMVRPSRFFTKMFFGKTKEHGTKKVQVDLIVGRRKIAPFVRRGKEAIVVSDLGKQTQDFEPVNIRVKKDLDADQLLFTRGAGLPVHVPGGSGDQIAQGRMKRIAEEQADLRDMIDRTIEFLAAKAFTGSYNLTAEDDAIAVNFGMPSANKPTLINTAKWNLHDSAQPLRNIRDWKVIARKASGKVPYAAVMTTDLWNYFINTNEVQQFLDNRRIDLGKFESPKELMDMGAQYMGTVDNTDFYVYDEYFEDSSGDDQSMVAENQCLLISPAADNVLHFGAIEDLKSASVVGKYFSKDWITEDPSVYWLLVESHPLPVPHRPDAHICATVMD